MEEKLATVLAELANKYTINQLGPIILMTYSGRVGWDGDDLEKKIPGAIESYFKLYEHMKEDREQGKIALTKAAEKYLLVYFDQVVSFKANVYQAFLKTSLDLVQCRPRVNELKDDSWLPRKPEEFLAKVKAFVHMYPEILPQFWARASSECPYSEKPDMWHSYTYTTHGEAIEYLESIQAKQWIIDWMKFYRFEKDTFELTSQHEGPTSVNGLELLRK